jgi:hypothetical protein
MARHLSHYAATLPVLVEERSSYSQQLQELGGCSQNDDDRETREDLEARIQLKGEESDACKRRYEEVSSKLEEMEEYAGVDGKEYSVEQLIWIWSRISRTWKDNWIFLQRSNMSMCIALSCGMS